jgi:hypothetical protein
MSVLKAPWQGQGGRWELGALAAGESGLQCSLNAFLWVRGLGSRNRSNALQPHTLNMVGVLTELVTGPDWGRDLRHAAGCLLLPESLGH